MHAPQVVTYPQEQDAVLYYKSIQKQFAVPYVIYVDFETFLEPSEDKNYVANHVPFGICRLKVSVYEDEIFEPYPYSGPDVISKFYEHIYTEQENICAKLKIKKDMLPRTDEEISQYENVATCPNCCNSFDNKSRRKVKHHCHTTGRFIGSV